MTCDCTSYCGDDPDIRAGKVRFCSAWPGRTVPPSAAEQASKTRDVAGILHFLTPQQMAEEIVRLDAVIAGRQPNITMGRMPYGVKEGAKHTFTPSVPSVLPPMSGLSGEGEEDR